MIKDLRNNQNDQIDDYDIINDASNCDYVNIDDLKNVYSSLKAIHVNARDFRRMSKYEELGRLLEDDELGLDLAVVSETWFDAYDAANYRIPGYGCFQSPRPGGGGGGVAIYAHSALHLASSETWCSDDGGVQVVQIRVRRPGFEGFVIGAYSRSRKYYSTLIDLLDKSIPTNTSLPIILLGDMNIDLLKREGVTLEYCSFLAGKGIVQVVDLVTRPNLRSDAQDSGSCFDHVAIANCEGFIQIKSFVVPTIFSNHYPVGITLTGNKVALSNSSIAAPTIH